jgi:hypothetical protein
MSDTHATLSRQYIKTAQEEDLFLIGHKKDRRFIQELFLLMDLLSERTLLLYRVYYEKYFAVTSLFFIRF